MRILVTGHNGYIGTVLTPMLIEGGLLAAECGSMLSEFFRRRRQKA